MQHVVGLLRVLWFPPPIKLTTMIKLKYCWLFHWLFQKNVVMIILLTVSIQCSDNCLYFFTISAQCSDNCLYFLQFQHNVVTTSLSVTTMTVYHWLIIVMEHLSALINLMNSDVVCLFFWEITYIVYCMGLTTCLGMTIYFKILGGGGGGSAMFLFLFFFLFLAQNFYRKHILIWKIQEQIINLTLQFSARHFLVTFWRKFTDFSCTKKKS